ncbi:MAG: hypothetical protein ACSLE6_00135 [Mycobacterium sp.]
MARATDLLERIEEGALDPDRPLADTLRLCVALGGRASSADLRDWARRELDGYGADDELPDYRVVTVPILIDGSNFHAIITGQQVAPSDIPDFARDEISGQLGLRMGVAAVEQMARKPDGSQLQHPGMAELVSYMNATNQGSSTIHRMYWSLQPTGALAVVDTIRTSLVALIAELRAAGVTGVDTVDAAVAEQAVNVVIHNAPRGNVTVNSAVSSGRGDAMAVQLPATAKSAVPGWVRGPWGFTVGAATIVAGYASLAVAAGWPPF